MYIYKVTNLITGKIYIGQDTNEDKNYFGSGNIIKKALKKYGKENFVKEILEVCLTQEDLNEREIYWISFYNSTDLEIGYNIAQGGSGKLGCKHSEETKKLFSEQRKGPKNSNYGKTLPQHQKEILREAGKKRVGPKNTFYGKQHTEETKQKIGSKNSINLSKEKEEEILELYKDWGAREISKRTGLGVKKIYNVLKKHNVKMRKAGPIRGHSYTGKPLSEEHKRKLSLAFSGEKHPMFGKRGKKSSLYKNIPEEIKNKVVEMYCAGERLKTIKKNLNISDHKIKEILEENKIERRGIGHYVREPRKGK